MAIFNSYVSLPEGRRSDPNRLLDMSSTNIEQGETSATIEVQKDVVPRDVHPAAKETVNMSHRNKNKKSKINQTVSADGNFDLLSR